VAERGVKRVGAWTHGRWKKAVEGERVRGEVIVSDERGIRG
jgi:hypothetical protein